MRGIGTFLFLFFALAVGKQAWAQQALPSASGFASETVVAKKILGDCPRCRQALLEIKRLPLGSQQEFVADPVTFQQSHPEILGLPEAQSPAQGTADLQSPTESRNVSAGDQGPQVTGVGSASPSFSGTQMLAMRQLTLEGLESSAAPSSDSASPSNVSFGSRTVRTDEPDGGVPTSQDPQYFPPNSGDNSGGGNGSGEANPPPREVEAPPELQPTFGKGVQEVFKNAPSYGPVGLLVGAFITIFRDEDPNAPAHRAPTPEQQAALPSLLGKGAVTSGNSDPTENRGLRSMESPDQVQRQAPASNTGFRPSLVQVVDPNVVDPNPDGVSLDTSAGRVGDSGVNCSGAGDEVRPGAPSPC